MKFLCVPCDKQMKLEQTMPQAQGSVSLVYSCSECGYEFAMLTNALETQLVGSLGVKIGAEGQPTTGSKCPFTGVVQEMTGAEKPGEGDFAWTSRAAERMANVPEFVRPMVKTGIEKFARDRGYDEIDERVLEEAKLLFGM